MDQSGRSTYQIGQTLYQTLQNRGNKEEVLEKAPFCCTREDAWLGIGYYFWEEEELAHWWGSGNPRWSESYIICKTGLSIPQEQVLDLVGNISHISLLRYLVAEYQKTSQAKQSPLTLPKIIKFIERTMGKGSEQFPYRAIRLQGRGSKVINLENTIRQGKQTINFTLHNSKVFLDLYPPIQICVFDRKDIHRPVEIIYPK